MNDIILVLILYAVLVLFKALRYWIYDYRDFCIKSPFPFKPLSLIGQPFWIKKLAPLFFLAPYVGRADPLSAAKLLNIKTHKKLTFMLI